MIMSNQRMRLYMLFIAFLLMTQYCDGQYFIKDPKAISLDGKWLFAMDPLEVGVVKGWYQQRFLKSRWDEVQVPHCFSVDKRYQYYNGTAWYRRDFSWRPKSTERVILHFDAVYYMTNVWINDQQVGTHEGGYTPFDFDITPYLKAGSNTIALSVNNNTWKTGLVPGAKDDGMPGNPFMGWMNYGGITRPIYLTIEPQGYIANVKVEAVPDLVNGTAELKVKTYINHLSDEINPSFDFSVRYKQQPVRLSWEKAVHIKDSGQISVWETRAKMKSSDVKLWDIDNPQLYSLQSTYNVDTSTTIFGIRKLEVKDAQLLLNGKPVKAGGANRVVDYPGLGSLEPDSLVEKDFRMMKQAGMIFQRLTHYTPNEFFYQLADRYGMLIIAEAGNWQLTPDQMDSDTVRQKYRNQLSEMIHRDWNHPSVIAFSVGNEYASDEASGQRWTKDMIAFGRTLDQTRLFTFASNRLKNLPKTAADEASRYCDFICSNTYGNHIKVLQHIHSLYPDKPILVSEWGERIDHVGDAGIISHIKKVAGILRGLPYVIGASLWSYNDYESRFSGTNVNGYREWGLVDPYRNPRQAYYIYQQEMSPIVLEVVKQASENGQSTITVRVTARKHFPAYPVRHYYLKADNMTYPIADLNPGDSTTVVINRSGFEGKLDLAIYTPTGFRILDQQIQIQLTE